jgi:hypothetical protein
VNLDSIQFEPDKSLLKITTMQEIRRLLAMHILVELLLGENGFDCCAELYYKLVGPEVSYAELEGGHFESATDLNELYTIISQTESVHPLTTFGIWTRSAESHLTTYMSNAQRDIKFVRRRLKTILLAVLSRLTLLLQSSRSITL